MSVDVVDLGTFSRQWAVEGRRIAWLFGAGASVSAQVPTDHQIVLVSSRGPTQPQPRAPRSQSRRRDELASRSSATTTA